MSDRVQTYDELLGEYQREKSEPGYAPVRLGFGSIDTEIRGVSVGQVCGLASRTGVGKTWALVTVEDNFAAREDAGSLALSLEMPGVEWTERSLAIHADVPPETVEAWAHEKMLLDKARELGFLERRRRAVHCQTPLRLDDLATVCAEARTRLDPLPLRLLLIDYLGLLNVQGRDAYERASALGKGLKQLAKEEAVAIVVALQLSRAAGSGAESVTIDMLRDSGVIEESCDFVLGLWQPGLAKNLDLPEELNLRDVLRASVLKNRKGRAGHTVDLRFRTESRRVYEPADPFAAAER